MGKKKALFVIAICFVFIVPVFSGKGSWSVPAENPLQLSEYKILIPTNGISFSLEPLSFLFISFPNIQQTYRSNGLGLSLSWRYQFCNHWGFGLEGAFSCYQFPNQDSMYQRTSIIAKANCYTKEQGLLRFRFGLGMGLLMAKQERFGFYPLVNAEVACEVKINNAISLDIALHGNYNPQLHSNDSYFSNNFLLSCHFGLICFFGGRGV